MKILVVVDMQNDFVTGALRNEEGIKIVPYVKEKIKEAIENKDAIFFTRDTHQNDYLETEEGKNLPIPHCIENTKGWEIVDELKEYEKYNYNPFNTKDYGLINKETFGSNKLGIQISNCIFLNSNINSVTEIEFIGLCTDICVISNVLLTKAFVPNVPISVDAKCCAGINPQSHDNALNAMKMCHINVKNQGLEPWRN